MAAWRLPRRLRAQRWAMMVLLAVGVQLAWAEGAVSVKSLEPDKALAAIRQALQDAALQAPLQVYSTAWIDESGALREASQFHTQARVRGIRLPQYVVDEAKMAGRIEVDLELPAHWAQSPRPQVACESVSVPWRMPLRITWSVAPALHGPQAHVADWVMSHVLQDWGHMLNQSQRWYVDQRPERLGQGAAHTNHHTYWSHLLGAEAVQGPSWQLAFHLQPASDTQGEWKLTAALQSSAQSPQWTWSLRFVPLPSRTHVAEHPLSVLRRWSALAGPAMLQASACQPVHFELRPDVNASTWVAPAGHASGLTLGDRLLIMDKTAMPKKILEPGRLSQLALAEVTMVGNDRTVIRQIAGPTLPQGSWVALPL